MLKFNSLKTTIIGLGVSGLSAAKLLKTLGAEVRVTDSRYSKAIAKRARALKRFGIKEIETGGHTKKFIKDSKLIVISPGVKRDNEILKAAKKSKIKVISEIELGFLVCRAPIIAITGTNGKTTTCALVSEFLNKAGYETFACGNIGRPFCDVAFKAKSSDIIVLEVSSFQLRYTDKFKPRVSIILNADIDHLDYHKTLSEYFKAKAGIYKNQTEGDFCILRKEDFKNIFSKYKIKSKLILVSSKEKAGVYLNKEGYIVNSINKKSRKTINALKLNLEGVKSVENILFLIALASIYNIEDRVLLKVVNNFKGLEHRIEIVGVFKHVKYINDSKATNVSAARLALSNIVGPVILIAGGEDKDTDFSSIDFNFLKNVKEVILFGQSKDKLACALKGIKPILIVKDLKEAVRFSKDKAEKGDCVLLSPMCASFDMFDDYKHRGRLFKEYVRKIK